MEAIAESLQIPNETPQSIASAVKRPFITKENAKLLQSKAVAAIARKKAERAAAIARIESDTEMLRPLMAKAVDLATSLAAKPEQEYKLEQLAHTREEIKACHEVMQSLRNGPARDYKAMSDALWRLREIERHLAGWPGPGNNQPSKRQSHPISATIEPL